MRTTVGKAQKDIVKKILGVVIGLITLYLYLKG